MASSADGRRGFARYCRDLSGFSRAFEALEDRRLLSSGPDLVSLSWQGGEYTAASHQWIIKLSDELNAAQDNAAGDLSSQLDLSALGDPTATLRNLMDGFELLVAPQASLASIEAWAASQSVIEYFEPNFIQQISDNPTTVVPNDTNFSGQWALRNTGQSGGLTGSDIDAASAWGLTTGSAVVVIAIIDTGMDYNHPDLAANVWINPGEIAGNGVDDDGNGFIDDVRGWDFAYNDANPMDGDGHGTHVAGIIGAVGNNGKGVSGANWNVRMMPLKFLDDNGSGATADAIAALNYLTMMKRDYDINIVASNNSWGGGGASTALRDAIAASGRQDILFIAAAGNGGNDGVGDNNDLSPQYPSNYALDNIIAVAASDRRDELADFSNFGRTSVDLAAPGDSILSTLPSSNYGNLSGTSMATPYVSGVVALLASYAPTASSAQIKAAILNSVDPVAAFANRMVSGGRLNAYQALQQIAGGPFVADVSPGGNVTSLSSLTANFTQAILPASVTPENFLLRGAGVDGDFDSGDDVVITLSAQQLSQPSATQVVITLAEPLMQDEYRLTLLGTGATPLRNMAGQAINAGHDYVHLFQVVSVAGPNEPNDSLASATVSSLTGPGQASFSAVVGDGVYGEADVDLFAFQVQAGATLSARVSANAIGSGLDSYLRLFNAAGAALAADDDSGASTDSVLSYSFTADGTYYLGVSAYGNSSYQPAQAGSGSAGESTGEFDLHITIAGGGGDSGEIVLQGADITLGINADGSLIASSPFVGAQLLGNEFLTAGVPQASFSLAAGGSVYQNNAPANGESQIAMTVSDLSAGSTLHARAVGSAGGIEITRDIQFSRENRYVIFDVSLSNNTAGSISDVAFLESLDPDQGYSSSGSFQTNNDVLFSGRYGEAVVYLSAFPDGLTMGLGSSDSRATAGNQGLDVADPFAVIDNPQDQQGVADDVALNLAFEIGTLAAGGSASFRYFLLLDSSAQAARDSYQELADVSAAFEPNETLASASSVALIANQVSTITAAIGDAATLTYDVDLYALTVAAGDSLTADMSAAEAGSSLDSVLRLFDAGGDELAYNDDFGFSLDSFIRHTFTNAGTYYLGVSGYSNTDYDPLVSASGRSGSTGFYDLRLTLRPGGAPGDSDRPFASVSAPDIVVPGGFFYDFSVTYSDDTGINAATLGTGDVRVTGPNSFSRSATLISVDSVLNGTPRTALYSIAAPGFDWDESTEGSYTITMIANQVMDISGNSVPAGALGSFRVDFSGSGDEFEPDDTAGQATALRTDGTAQEHSIDLASDVDWMRFEIDQTSAVTISTEGSSGDTELWLYGPDDATRQVDYDDDSGAGLFSLITRGDAQALTPGTYFLRVSSYRQRSAVNSYEISVTAAVQSEYSVALSASQSAQYYDDAGRRVRLTLRGPGSGELVLPAGPQGDALSLTLDDTTSATALVIAGPGGRASTSLGELAVSGALRALTAPGVDILGNANIAGGLVQLQLHGLSGGTLTLGGIAASVGSTVSITQLADAAIASSAPIRSLTVGSWISLDGEADQVTAPWIGRLISRGDWAADVTLDDASQALALLSIRGVVRGSTIRTAGSITSAVLTSMSDSAIYAGVSAETDGLPVAAAAFTNPTATIARLTFLPAGNQGYSMINSVIAAYTLGRVTIRQVQGDNDDVDFGLAARRLTYYSRIIAGQRPVTLRNQLAPPAATLDEEGDFLLNLL